MPISHVEDLASFDLKCGSDHPGIKSVFFTLVLLYLDCQSLHTTALTSSPSWFPLNRHISLQYTFLRLELVRIQPAQVTQQEMHESLSSVSRVVIFLLAHNNGRNDLVARTLEMPFAVAGSPHRSNLRLYCRMVLVVQNQRRRTMGSGVSIKNQ
jgi:hypothetical protein